MTHILQSKQFLVAFTIVVAVAFAGSFLRPVKSAPAIDPTAQAAADWMKENVAEYREIRSLYEQKQAEFDRQKSVLDTFNCVFDWDNLRVIDCPKK